MLKNFKKQKFLSIQILLNINKGFYEKMGLFSKKKEEDLDEVPELPELPRSNLDFPSIDEYKSPMSRTPFPETPPGLPGLPKDVEIDGLPLLPQPDTEGRFNQKEIKHAITFPQQPFPDAKMQKSNLTPSFPVYQSKTRPIETFEHPKPPEPFDKEMPRTLELPEKPSFKPSTKKAEPVYIRLDKFETTLESFQEIKNKINEIEKLLAKTREIKAQEEKELEEWENELQAMRARIDAIDKTIFDRLE